MPDTTTYARPVRTAVQVGAAGVIVEFVDAFIFDLSEQQYGALLGLLTIVLGYVQVLVEDRTGKGFLRHPPDAPTEVVEDGTPPATTA